ncbi:hypothetical protein [Parasitella parasitica]|uniref:Uncharacterized protein n=1 Tax=Parasitella parasitica TaxID=35722 RepID=A0A0B7MWT4_9FUNG|nr:hypothetical protein [Parasitella parasitica]
MYEADNEPASFIEKVRLDKEKKLNAAKSRQAPVSFSAPSNSSSTERLKPSISEYRASRGLSPSVSNRGVSVQRQPGTGSSSLFIKKRPTASRPNRQPNALPDGISAKERAYIEHSAAKDRMRSYREEERRRDRPDQAPRADIRNIDNIVQDVQNKYKRH